MTDTSRETWSPEADLGTPYMQARQEWDARMGSALVHAKNWRLAAFACFGLVAVALVGLIVLGAQPKAVPHIIEVDRVGNATYHGPLGQEATAFTPSEDIVRYHLRRFIEDTRTISSDAAVLKRNWLDAYGLVTPHGGNMLSAYVAEPGHDPFARAKQERVTAEVVAMVRVSGDTWQIDWKESTFDTNGNPSSPPMLWRGMFRTVFHLPKTPEAMAHNPIGLFIDEMHWDRVQG